MLWHTYTKEETTATTTDGSNRRCASLCFFSFCLFPKRFCVSNRKQKRNPLSSSFSLSLSLALSLFARFSFSFAVIFFLAFFFFFFFALPTSINSESVISMISEENLFIPHLNERERERESERKKRNSAKIKAIDIVSPIEGWTHAEQLGSMKLLFAFNELIGSTDWMIFPKEQGGEERALIHPTWRSS